jgi:acetylornithine deacetylase/succinyl-diaminopimelate desuccinylase-like protein
MLTTAILLALSSTPLFSQQPDTGLRARVAAWRAEHEGEVFREYVALLRIPNLASDSGNIRRNAAVILQMLQRRGIAAQLLEAPGSPPAVFGELPAAGAARTVVLYAHYDGQPVDTARWVSPPWQPVLRDRALFAGGKEIPFPAAGARFNPEWRLYARSTGDDKGSILAQLTALDALHALGLKPSVNLKFFYEGEEEAGSTHIRDMLSRHAALLRADLWLMGDGPVHQTRRQLLSFGVRGDMGLQLTVYGPARPLHSGHYGNWAPNPDVLLVHLLASLRDETGRILIEHYYDEVRPVSAAERAALASVPPVEEQLLGELRLGGSEGGATPLAERILLPALNLSGLSGGRTGTTAANVIVSEANAFIDIRMVPDQRPERVRQLILEHLRRQGYFVVSGDPDSATRRQHPKVAKAVFSPGYPASRTALDGPAARALISAIQKDLPYPLITEPTSGGSDATYVFREVLRTEIIGVPISNHDNNQHAENENMRLQNLWDGIGLYAGLIARLGGEWRLLP